LGHHVGNHLLAAVLGVLDGRLLDVRCETGGISADGRQQLDVGDVIDGFRRAGLDDLARRVGPLTDFSTWEK